MIEINPASFRDPDGFIFEEGGKLYRQVNKSAENDFKMLIFKGGSW